MKIKSFKFSLLVFAIFINLSIFNFPIAGAKVLNVVTTLPDYAELVKTIGGDKVSVEHIVQGVQDPHNIRPKPSFVHMVSKADILVSTGLDLEMWLPTVINKSGNRRIRSGEIGFIAVSHDMPLMDKPQVFSQAEGDVHIYGNPHFTCSPLCMRKVADNITTGLIKNDPEDRELFENNLQAFQLELDQHLFGKKLVTLLGGKTLARLARQDKLMDFLNNNKFKGEPLINSLGGWMHQMMPLRGKKIVNFHKNWSYFNQFFGLDMVSTIEPKPGIPPSAKHVANLITMMREKNVKIIFSANYFDEQKVRAVADRVGAEAVIVPLFVGGASQVDTYFKLVDYWVDHLLKAAQNQHVIAEN